MIKGKRGENILTENIIFIVLNLVFISILILFLFSKAGDVNVLEEKYAKQIALLIDGAKPGMEIQINMENAIDKIENKEAKIVSIDENIVTVVLNEKGKGYSYSFFNNVELNKLYFYANEGKYFNFEIETYK